MSAVICHQLIIAGTDDGRFTSQHNTCNYILTSDDFVYCLRILTRERGCCLRFTRRKLHWLKTYFRKPKLAIWKEKLVFFPRMLEIDMANKIYCVLVWRENKNRVSRFRCDYLQLFWKEKDFNTKSGSAAARSAHLPTPSWADRGCAAKGIICSRNLKSSANRCWAFFFFQSLEMTEGTCVFFTPRKSFRDFSWLHGTRKARPDIPCLSPRPPFKSWMPNFRVWPFVFGTNQCSHAITQVCAHARAKPGVQLARSRFIENFGKLHTGPQVAESSWST